MVPNQWNRLNTCFTTVHRLNKGGNTLPTSFGNSLQIRRILVQESLFIWCSVFLINLCAKYLIDSITFGSFWAKVFHGLFGANELILYSTIYSDPLRKHDKSFGTPCKIMVGSLGNGGSRIWKRPTCGLSIHPQRIRLYVGVKNLIVTRSNLIVTWMDNRPQTNIISWFHSGCAALPELVVFWVTFAIKTLNLCPKNKTKTKALTVGY